jgi:hypothetical protein
MESKKLRIKNMPNEEQIRKRKARRLHNYMKILLIELLQLEVIRQKSI